MGALPQVLQIIFEVQRKMSNENNLVSYILTLKYM